MIKYPEFFVRSNESIMLNPTLPIAPLNFNFDPINSKNFISVFKDLVDSGNLYNYENFKYEVDDNIIENLESQVYDYVKSDTGYSFRRYARLANPGGPVTMRVHNASYGWFPEIVEFFPEMVSTIVRFILEQKIKNIFSVSVLYSNEIVPWHLDPDGYYGFRLNLNDCKFRFDFKKIIEDKKLFVQQEFLAGSGKEMRDNLDQYVESDTRTITSEELGQSFIINSVDYVHQFYSEGPSLIALVYGTV